MPEQIPLRCINPFVRHVCRVEMRNTKPEGYFRAYDRVMLCICCLLYTSDAADD